MSMVRRTIKVEPCALCGFETTERIRRLDALDRCLHCDGSLQSSYDNSLYLMEYQNCTCLHTWARHYYDDKSDGEGIGCQLCACTVYRPLHSDPVSHPAHYTQHPSGVECIQITRHYNFCLGNVIKYVWRAPYKGNMLEDLRKAQWYLNDEIERLENAGH